MIPKVLAIDAGGTMTDTFVVDAEGEFVVGKAQTTPEDESQGFLQSCADAFGYLGRGTAEAFPGIVSGIYSGTSMLNRLLERKGPRLGLIVTAGMEDALRFELGVQTYANYSYADRLHVATHVHNTPLVPRERIRGVRERTDLFGNVAVPLYEDEAEAAVRELLARGVEGIVVCLLMSWKNPGHEVRIREIARRIMEQAGCEVPVYLSAEYYPLQRDFARLNTTVIEAYAAGPSRRQLQHIQSRISEGGGRFKMRVMAGHGGTVGIEARELAKTLVSGPIGGVIGARYLAEKLEIDNIICTDIGGTSFDLAVITGGEYHIKTHPTIERFLLNIPMIEVNSVGSGTGSLVRIDPTYQRLTIGPDSAGSRIGVCWPEGGVDTVSITDCNLVLGLVNPDNFLGGKVKLDPVRAYNAIKEQIADKLGLDVYRAAAGIVELMEGQLRNYVEATILGKGYAPAGFSLISYGGGGPLHAAGYSDGLGFENVLVPAWAAGFSAFGCACADLEYRSDLQVNIPFAGGGEGSGARALIESLGRAWEQLKEEIMAQFTQGGFTREQVTFRKYLRMQYQGQLRDLEVGPVQLDRPGDVGRLVDAFEELYARVYARAAKSPELGYFITRAILRGSVEVEKPRLPADPVGDRQPAGEAAKGQRNVYWKGTWLSAAIWDMDLIRAGNVIEGPAVVEASATTLVVPPDYAAAMDRHRIFHLQKRS